MTVFLAVLGAIFGALLGGILGFFAVILIGTLTGADTQQGALAMGAATLGMPLGGLIGLGLGLGLTIRWRARRAKAEAVRAAREAGETPSAGGAFGTQALIAIAVVGVAVLVAWNWWTDDGTPPLLPRPFPVLEAEIRLPADDPGIPFATGRPADLRSGIVYHSMGPPVKLREEDGQAILGMSIPMSYRTEDRGIEILLEPGKRLTFPLDIPARPAVDPAFSEWVRVGTMSWYRVGVLVETDGPPPYFIRTRVLAGQ